MTRVIVQVVPRAVQALRHNEPPAPETRALAELLETLGIELRPTHPVTRDPELSTWFETDAPDLATAEQIASKLQANSAVEAAYIKPPEEPPRD